MVAANRPEPRLVDQVQALYVFCTAINQVAYGDEQVFISLKANLIQTVHQVGVAAVQVANNPDIAPVSAVNALINAHAIFLLAARRSQRTSAR